MLKNVIRLGRESSGLQFLEGLDYQWYQQTNVVPLGGRLYMQGVSFH